ncbi:hypothetical protein [Amycolatopsis pithecellobii]|uniref:Uncharacterized protein n=1 Tax=Amycolatopsis pithecellobii TaxID=664692 RepID=A0A6N7YRS0_9PSEU|nr:hypothetical protein [Amycolatopsis pithecellobii]MTD55725.1 hypothetical protein [Amycolatopsis pithecellobii]
MSGLLPCQQAELLRINIGYLVGYYSAHRHSGVVPVEHLRRALTVTSHDELRMALEAVAEDEETS